MHSFETLKKYVQLISLIVFFQHLIQNTDLKLKLLKPITKTVISDFLLQLRWRPYCANN